MLNKKAILIASMIIYSKGYAIEVKFSCIAFSLTPHTQVYRGVGLITENSRSNQLDF